MHWNLPSNPVDLEQREGRIHRYKGHALRKNIAQQFRGHATDSNFSDPWSAMFEEARKSRPDGQNDLYPFWISPDGDAKIERYVPRLPHSREVLQQIHLQRSLVLYRMVFGQHRQEDLINYLRQRFSDEQIAELVEVCRIDLSPPQPIAKVCRDLMTGRSIRIYLVEGDASGLLTAEVMNWSGKFVVAPRTMLKELAAREEVSRTGVYILVGPDPENPTQDMVYVGEGDNVFKRITAHDKDSDKEFWTRCALVISKDLNLTKGHVRYLESRIIEKGHASDRARLFNVTAPPLPPMPEPDAADMEGFLSHVELVLPVLGFDFLKPKRSYTRLAMAMYPRLHLFLSTRPGTPLQRPKRLTANLWY